MRLLHPGAMHGQHLESGQVSNRGRRMSAMRWPWGLSLLALLLLQACATPPKTLLCGKPFKPSSSKPAAQPSKPPANNPPHGSRSAAPSYKLGQSDGGPGQWEKAPVRTKGAGYQQEITGAPEGVEYAVPARTPSGKVLFDGYRDGKLLDAKDWEKWPPADAEFWQRSVREDALRQLNAARGTPIEWHFPNEDKAQAVRTFFNSAGISGIDVKVTRKK